MIQSLAQPVPCEVLLVEDNPSDAELTIRALRAAGVSIPIAVASDGPEALAYLLDSANRPLPCVVLLDLKLPKLDGLDVLARLRENKRTCRLPIVVLSSSAELPDIRAAYDVGANSYIVKPVDFEELMQVIGKVGLFWTHINRVPF